MLSVKTVILKKYTEIEFSNVILAFANYEYTRLVKNERQEDGLTLTRLEGIKNGIFVSIV